MYVMVIYYIKEVLPFHQPSPMLRWSAQRVATSIRRELKPIQGVSQGGVIIRLIIEASPSLWTLVDEKVTAGRKILMLTSLPDDDALISLMGTFCAKQPCLHQMELSDDLRLQALTDEERTFLVDAARESKELWVSEKNPLKLVFHPEILQHFATITYPPALVEFILAKLDAVR